MTQALRILQASYSNTLHAQAIVQLLDAYAQDPAGGGTPLRAARSFYKSGFEGPDLHQA